MFKKWFIINYLPEIPGLTELDKTYGESKIYLTKAFIWPGQNGLSQYFGRLFTIINLVTTLIFQLHTTFYVIQPPINWEFAIQNLFELSFALMLFSMYYIFSFMRREVHDYTTMTVNFWKSITDPDQKQFILNISQFHRKIAIIIRVIIFASFTGFAISPVSVPYAVNYIFPNKYNLTPKLCTTAGSYLFDVNKHFFWFFLCSLFLMTQGAVVGVALCSAAAFFVSNALIRFNLLGFRLRKLSSLSESDNLQNSQFIYDEVRNLHQSHLSAIEYFEKCEHIGRRVLMIVSIYILIGLSFSGTMILFSLSVNNYFLVFEMIISFIAVIFLAFLIAHFGQIVVNASDDIFYDYYFCGWYNFSSNTKPHIIMMMIRALRPCELKAGPSAVLTMNYENFSAIVNTAVSYMTVMASLI